MKKCHLVLMSYWRPVSDWFVGYLHENKVQKIAYIINANKRQFLQDPDYPLYDFEFLKSEGFDIEAVDLDKLAETNYKFAGVDLIYVRGGNTFDLLNSVINSGFDKRLPILLDSGVIYASTSAGSILVGPDIELADNDFAPDYNIVELKNTSGLGLVDFAVFPHWEEKWRQKLDSLMSERKVNYPVKTLRDNQVVIINDGRGEVLSI